MSDQETPRVKDARMAPGVTTSEKSGRVCTRVERGEAYAADEKSDGPSVEKQIRESLER